jgi:hypothetical protein
VEDEDEEEDEGEDKVEDEGEGKVEVRVRVDRKIPALHTHTCTQWPSQLNNTTHYPPEFKKDGSHHVGLTHSFLEQHTLNPPFSFDPLDTLKAPPKGTQACTVQGARSISAPVVLPARLHVSCAQLKHLRRRERE